MKALIVLGAFFVLIYFIILGFAAHTQALRESNADRVEKSARNCSLLATTIFAVVWWALGPPMF